MITPTSSNEDFLNSIDTNVFTNLINNNDIINELQIAEINKKIIKSLDEYKREYQEKLEKDICEFEEYKKEKTEELNNLIEISTQLTAKIKENERLLEIEKTKFKLFTSKRKLNKIIEEDMKIYTTMFAKISSLHEDILNINKWIDKTKSFL
jgi:predicted transcriptional regulator YdeE